MISLLLFMQMTLASATNNIEKTPDQVCAALDQAFQKRDWGKAPCEHVKSSEWKTGGTSVKGRPLLYTVFGNENASNTTLIFSMVHGDEITPLYVGFQIIAWAKENMDKFKDARLVIAPLVNPDGFLGFPKTRTNARGVDCNRNFDTHDWKTDALKAWKHKFHSEKRRFPGKSPNSEPETLFQKMMIEKFQPQKIVSIHSPLNMIDYDGPGQMNIAEFSAEYIQKCEDLRKKIKAKSSGFFPGSLGNYTGQELGIPTITLELPTTRSEKAKLYWDQLKNGIKTVIQYKVPSKEKD